MGKILNEETINEEVAQLINAFNDLRLLTEHDSELKAALEKVEAALAVFIRTVLAFVEEQ